MRIVSLSGAGVLSFDHFRLDLDERVTFLVGPNGAGKSNVGRLLDICQRAVEKAAGGSGDVDRLLALFLAARHVGAPGAGIEVRAAIQLADEWEHDLVTWFFRAMVISALTAGRQATNIAELDAWAKAEITGDKLRPLMNGEIAVSHPGTEDGQWECAYEFTAPGRDRAERRYRWLLLGSPTHTIADADAPVPAQGSDIAARVTGSPGRPPGPGIPVPGAVDLARLLPDRDRHTVDCTVGLPGARSQAQRRFAELAGLPLHSPAGIQSVGLASALRAVFRRALVGTSDTRLLPSGGVSWSSSELSLRAGAEARLPEFLLALKNGDPSERARYRRIQGLFTEFTQGRGFEVGLARVHQPGEEGQPGTALPVPAVWVTVSDGGGPSGHEVPVEFAGAGAWEALVLASVLGEPSASVVVLDEPAVGLHPSLQRKLGAHLLDASAQFVVITHSAELLPPAAAAGTRLVRLDRDASNATQAWPVSGDCWSRIARKLAAKGNERLPFARRVILCEGESDVEAIFTLAERMGSDLRRDNIAVADCGGRDNLPGYIWFCAELGLRYLAVMDGDSGTEAAAAKARAVREAVNRHGGGELFEFDKDLEAAFGVTKQRSSLVPGKIREFPFADDGLPDPAAAPAEVIKLAEAIRRLAE